MTTIKKSALLPYSAAQMYALVDDIASYPQFLPWCKDAKVFSRNADEVHAQIHIAHGALNKAFSTTNRLQPGKIIEMRLADGPFKHLEGFWRFDELSSAIALGIALPRASVHSNAGCKISLDLDFKFSNKLIELAIGSAFNHIANSLVDAFCQRAKQVYG